MSIPYTEAALQRCTYENAPRKIRSSSTGEHPRTNSQNIFPKKHPQRTGSAYIQKSKLI